MTPFAARIAAAALAVFSPTGHVNTDEFAAAVESVTKDTDWAALLVTIAAKESAGLDRLRAGECLAWECDPRRVRGELHHAAWGLFQAHQNKNNAAVWGSTDLLVQVTEANRALVSGFWTCAQGIPRGSAHSIRVQLAINGYAGKRCDDFEWPGLKARLAMWRSIRGRL